MSLRPRSLRRQLTLLGAAAVLIPLLALFSVVSFTFSSEEVFLNEDGTPRQMVEESTTVPTPVIVAAILLSAVGCVAVWFWAGRAVQPMAKIASVADDIQAGSLDRRIAMRDGASEVRVLADSFDAMLDRLAVASNNQQRLVEDASHELRTPLAALAVNNEIILQKPRPTLDDYRASAERNEALITRLQTTIDELLADARARTETVRRVDNDLMAIVRRVVDQQRIVAPGVPIVVRGPAELRLGIDGPSMERALVNLLDNATRYSPPGVSVEVSVAGGEEPRLHVTDRGPGIPVDRLATVFDRYDRDDQTGRSGIGLALVKQVAEAHGSIEVTSPLEDGTSGTRFTMTFTTPSQPKGA